MEAEFPSLTTYIAAISNAMGWIKCVKLSKQIDVHSRLLLNISVHIKTNPILETIKIMRKDNRRASFLLSTLGGKT